MNRPSDLTWLVDDSIDRDLEFRNFGNYLHIYVVLFPAFSSDRQVTKGFLHGQSEQRQGTFNAGGC
jgi:hypothetical protein